MAPQESAPAVVARVVAGVVAARVATVGREAARMKAMAAVATAAMAKGSKAAEQVAAVREEVRMTQCGRR